MDIIGVHASSRTLHHIYQEVESNLVNKKPANLNLQQAKV